MSTCSTCNGNKIIRSYTTDITNGLASMVDTLCSTCNGTGSVPTEIVRSGTDKDTLSTLVHGDGSTSQLDAPIIRSEFVPTDTSKDEAMRDEKLTFSFFPDPVGRYFPDCRCGKIHRREIACKDMHWLDPDDVMNQLIPEIKEDTRGIIESSKIRSAEYPDAKPTPDQPHVPKGTDTPEHLQMDSKKEHDQPQAVILDGSFEEVLENLIDQFDMDGRLVQMGELIMLAHNQAITREREQAKREVLEVERQKALATFPLSNHLGSFLDGIDQAIAALTPNEPKEAE